MNNRQASRRRGRGNNRPQTNNRGGGFDHQNRVDNRARGNASQMLEKYRKLASDAQTNGDRVTAESYFQFADHYFRVLADFRMRNESRGDGNANRNREREPFNDDDFTGDDTRDSFSGNNGDADAGTGRGEDRYDDDIADSDNERLPDRSRTDRPRRDNTAGEPDRGAMDNDDPRDRGRDDDDYNDDQGTDRMDSTIVPPSITASEPAERQRAPRVRRPRAQPDVDLDAAE